MANITSNSTQLHDDFEMLIVIWYAAVGISGVIGNSFIIAVMLSRSRLNSSHLMITWLGCTDLISCLCLPLRFKTFYQVKMVSPSLCALGRCIVVFLSFLSLNSLGTVAIERHNAVQNINKNKHLSSKTVRALVVICIMTSVIFTIPFILYVVNDSTLCRELDSLNVNPNFFGFMIPTTLIIMSTFVVIAVLYVKICILVRARVICEPNSVQELRHENHVQELRHENPLSEPVRPTDEDKADSDFFSWWTKEQMNLNQVKNDEEFKGAESECTSFQFVDLQLVEETQSPLRQDAVSSQPSIYMISGASPIPRLPQSGQESGRQSVSSCEYHFPGPSPSSWHQIPGLVDEFDNETQIPPPTIHNTIIVQPDSGLTKNDEPVVTPVLKNQYQHIDFMITRRVTLMLFIITLVFFVTYFVSSILVQFIPYGLGRHFCREFVMINHAINPVIYSIANEGFRESCISFVQRIRERFGF